MLACPWQPTKEVPMSTAPSARMVPPGEGKRVMLFAVRFDYKVTSADSGGALAALEVTIPPGTLVKPHNHSREECTEGHGRPKKVIRPRSNGDGENQHGEREEFP